MSLLHELDTHSTTNSETLKRLWWCWRHGYLAAKEHPDQRDALLQRLDGDVQALFDRVWHANWTQAREQFSRSSETEIDAMVCASLIRRAEEECLVPIPGPDGGIDAGKLTDIPTHDPYLAAPSHQAWTTVVSTIIQSFRNPDTVPLKTRTVVIAGLCVLGVGVWTALSTNHNDRARAASQRAMPTPNAGAVVTDTAVASPPETNTAVCDAQQYAAPVFAGQRGPLTFASIDVGGTVYTVQPTAVCNGAWRLSDTPMTASWLQSTYTNIVIAVPTRTRITSGDTVTVHDSHTTVRTFRVERVDTVRWDAIDALKQTQTGLTLVAPDTATTRVVAWATYHEGD